jgi:hypothetical protein
MPMLVTGRRRERLTTFCIMGKGAGIRQRQAMHPKNRRTYTGRSGQMAVMAELLDLGCNVAIPEVDVGRDLFAFQDEEEGVTHIQVKTAGKAKSLTEEGSYSAQIDVPLDQLKMTGPALYYVFGIRLKRTWTAFIVIERDRLNALRVEKDIGTEYEDKRTKKRFLKLTFSFTTDTVTCSGESFQEHRNAWTSLPPLHPEELPVDVVPVDQPGVSEASQPTAPEAEELDVPEGMDEPPGPQPG